MNDLFLTLFYIYKILTHHIKYIIKKKLFVRKRLLARRTFRKNKSRKYYYFRRVILVNKILYEVLCDKELLLLLCGGRYESPNGIMPYLSSTNIIDLGYTFGLPLNDYSMLARWDILKSLIKYCISKDIYSFIK